MSERRFYVITVLFVQFDGLFLNAKKNVPVVCFSHKQQIPTFSICCRPFLSESEWYGVCRERVNFDFSGGFIVKYQT